MKPTLLTALILTLAGDPPSFSTETHAEAAISPRPYVYREVDGKSLTAYVFSPAGPGASMRSGAILLFHGGGWSVGSAEWTFGTARRFAALGMVAISVEYRLSQDKVTPIEALEDTCAAFRWARQRAEDLHFDPRRVAGYGVSAGGQLVAAAATVGCPAVGSNNVSCRPDALLLWSPALDVAKDGWFDKLLKGRAPSADYSPVEHAGSSTPPTCIVQGAKDTLTPVEGAKRFKERVTRAGGICQLNVYEGVGHLLTRNLANQESNFDPDPEASAKGRAEHERFLKEQGFLSGK